MRLSRRVDRLEATGHGSPWFVVWNKSTESVVDLISAGEEPPDLSTTPQLEAIRETRSMADLLRAVGDDGFCSSVLSGA